MKSAKGKRQSSTVTRRQAAEELKRTEDAKRRQTLLEELSPGPRDIILEATDKVKVEVKEEVNGENISAVGGTTVSSSLPGTGALNDDVVVKLEDGGEGSGTVVVNEEVDIPVDNDEDTAVMLESVTEDDEGGMLALLRKKNASLVDTIVHLSETLTFTRREREALKEKVKEQQAIIEEYKEWIRSNGNTRGEGSIEADRLNIMRADVEGDGGTTTGSASSWLPRNSHTGKTSDGHNYIFSSKKALARFTSEMSGLENPFAGNGNVKFRVAKETLREEYEPIQDPFSLATVTALVKKRDSDYSYEEEQGHYKGWKNLFDKLQGYSWEFWTAVKEFLSVFGKDIGNVTMTQEDCGMTPVFMFKMLESGLQHLPNLKTLVVDVTFTECVEEPAVPSRYKPTATPTRASLVLLRAQEVAIWIRGNYLPAIPNLEKMEFLLKDSVPAYQLKWKQWKANCAPELEKIDRNMHSARFWNKFPRLGNVSVRIEQYARRGGIVEIEETDPTSDAYEKTEIGECGNVTTSLRDYEADESERKFMMVWSRNGCRNPENSSDC